MPINHAQLRAFHAVASAGSFTRAARLLHLTQPTLSEQVKALEQRYGVQLFERHGRKVQLTELGQLIHAGTQRLFAQETEIEQQLNAARDLTGGQLRVGADAPYLILPLLAVFNRRYPGVRLSLAFGNSESLLAGLQERRYDLVLMPEVVPDPRLHAVPLGPDRLVIFVDRGHPWAGRRRVRFRELAGQRLIQRESGSTTRALFERALAQAGVKPREVLEIGSREGVREAVAAGLGVGVVALSEFGSDTRLHALEVRDAELAQTEYVVCLEERRPLRAVRAFFEVLNEGGL